MKPTEGQAAPEFTLKDENNQPHSLSDYRGKPVVIFFYPRDDTPGCTKEACGFRDDYSAYQEAGVVILGISADDAASHTRFIQKYELPYPLLADTDHAVCDLYGVWGPKKFMGREYEGINRTTFLVGPDGTLLRTFEKVKPAEHSQEILGVLQELALR